ncbi:nuclear transport factor 2 family protein [Kordiimonas aquimaris]|uniref:nuclear transport factor 2 family protein n=1 Tax=Kordiimonas aquimaris TaxID=707591 RepID=UPI0021D3630F|nr:nuclear transport factor 2 family protein [Kordiimonas aquimaris]
MLAKNIFKLLPITLLLSTAVSAQDACSTDAVHALADVTVSDGKTYSVESLFRSRHQAASVFIQENGSTNVVEGPFSWVATKDQAELGGNFLRDYALGHQFHAFLLHFNDIVSDIEVIEDTAFNDKSYQAARGVLDTGGYVSLMNPNAQQPAGLRFELGEYLIDITLSDWREQDGVQVPFTLRIDDQQRIFNYRYQFVDTSQKPLMWFYDNVTAPDIDAIGIYRLHRKQLIAHCLADADMLASTLAPNVVMANGGQVVNTSPDQTRDVFENNVFKRRQYATYIDTKYPAIEVAASGDLGWAVVQLHTEGRHPDTGEPFNEHWAWTMLAKKIDNQWLMVGNTSNRQ